MFVLKSIVTLDEFTKETIQCVIEYMYTGKCLKTTDNMLDLLVAADMVSDRMYV